MFNTTSILARRAINSFVRQSHGGTPGENLPFQITNRYRLTAWFVVFFGSGLAAPFLVLRHQLLKNGKAARIKQAREQAQAEIERYRQERERQFKEYEAKHMGSKGDIAAKIDRNTAKLMDSLHREVERNKEIVLTELLDLVYDIKPKIHPNYFIMYPK